MQESGLSYGNAIVGDLVNRDTDGDGLLDWEESLWDTDPNNKDTNGDGVSDSVEIAKIKGENGASESFKLSLGEGEENLTETDKFSREFFATVATLNQSGEIDQATVEKLSSSLAERIQNSAPRKIFTLSDIKVIQDDSVQTVKNYDNALSNIQEKYPAKGNVMEVLQKFIIDENNVDVTVLVELDPIIEQVNKIIIELAKMSVPQSLVILHLNFLNALQGSSENVSDIKLYDTDVIVALSGISQYENNVAVLEKATRDLADAISQKLSN